MGTEFQFGMMKSSRGRCGWWLTNGVGVINATELVYLKMVKMGNFIPFIFYRSEKKKNERNDQRRGWGSKGNGRPWSWGAKGGQLGDSGGLAVGGHGKSGGFAFSGEWGEQGYGALPPRLWPIAGAKFWVPGLRASSLRPRERGGFFVTLQLCFPRICYNAWHMQDANICLNE